MSARQPNARLVVALVLVGLSIALWTATSDPFPSPAQAPEQVVPQTARPASAVIAPLTPSPETNDSYRPETPAEEVLAALAQIEGEGLLLCELPADRPDVIRSPFSRHHLRDRTLFGLVATTSGIGLLYPALTMELNGENHEAWGDALRASRVPFGTARWGEAWPGEVGWCEVVPIEEVTIRGRLVREDGTPAPEAHLNGCADQSTFPNAAGEFEIRTSMGEPCTLSVYSKGFGGTLVPRTGDVEDLEIVVYDLEERRRLVREHHQADREQLESLGGMADPWDAIFSDVPLSDAAREVARAWRQEDRAEAAAQRARQKLRDRVFADPEAD